MTRKDLAFAKRVEAATISSSLPPVTHEANGDESKFTVDPDKKNFPMSFTKGLKHDENTGLIENPEDFEQLADAIDTGDPEDFKLVPLGLDVLTVIDGEPVYNWHSAKAQNAKATVRAWESAGAGLTFDLQGPDAQAVTMPKAPALGSEELDAEMAEVYAQAILRDIPLSTFWTNNVNQAADSARVETFVDLLNKLPYFDQNQRTGNRPLMRNTIFRGITDGDHVGPYISQFLLAGDTGRGQRANGDPEFSPLHGQINYGAQTLSQKVRTALKNVNYMTTWEEWLDVQNGADLRGLEGYEKTTNKQTGRRFITTGRDLATYVHYDALYQAYLNACLLLLSLGAPFDPGIPFQAADADDRQQGFAHYGGPHILSLVTEVATRALKAVRYQKFNVHRRLRPEALAGRIERRMAIKEACTDEFEKMYNRLDVGSPIHNKTLTDEIRTFADGGKNMLLPMAFCEGSPMHPAYGAGHATVAGACVTILKAFFDENKFLNISSDGEAFSISDNAGNFAFVPEANGQKLTTVSLFPGEGLTVGGELNKLAANISIGRNWAGVHYFSDYEDSIKMGEEIALGLLCEQSVTYNPLEKASMSITKFNGETITIENGVVTHPVPA
ncbi:MAG: vanadium-dependent haloperoxidase [Bacteroidota bacterium]